MSNQRMAPSPEKVWQAITSFVKREAEKHKGRELTIYPIPSSSLGIDTGDYPRVSIRIEMDRTTRAVIFEASTQHSPGAMTKIRRGMFAPSEDSPWIYESRSGETYRLGEMVRIIFDMFDGV